MRPFDTLTWLTFFYWVRLNHILHLRLLSMHLLGKVRACLGQRAEEFLVVRGP